MAERGWPLSSSVGKFSDSIGTRQPRAPRFASILRAKQLPMVKTTSPGRMVKEGLSSGQTSASNSPITASHRAWGLADLRRRASGQSST